MYHCHRNLPDVNIIGWQVVSRAAASVLPYSGAGASRSILMVRLVRSAYLG
jgi:hypothetical protein